MRLSRTRSGGAPAIGLAFLDVLCCGLGSAVFLLLVIQYGPAPVEAQDTRVADAAARAESELEAVGQQIADLESALGAVADTVRSRLASLDAVAGLSDIQKRQVADAMGALNAERERLDAESAALDALRTNVPVPPTTPRQDLTGLRVQADGVAVFLDSSASMLDRSLVEILRLRVSADRLKLAAVKWRTARNAARWVYDRIPDGGRYRLFHFAEDMGDLSAGNMPLRRVVWDKKANKVTAPAQQESISRALAALVPNGATDLKQVFETAARLSPPPAQLVLITDGLPTLPGDTPLQRIRRCPRPRGNATPLITAECRASIFQDAAGVAARALPNTQIDIVLLPLQGDANAAGLFWNLSTSKGGRLLTPAEGWPQV